MASSFAKKGFFVDLFCQRISERKFPDNVHVVSIGTSRSVTSAWKYAGKLSNAPYGAWFVREPHLLLLTIIFYIVRTGKLPPYILYEIHDLPRDTFDAIAIHIVRRLKKFKVITITNSLGDDLHNLYKISRSDLLVLPDGVDLETFISPLSKAEAKNLISAGTSPLVVYSGSLFPWKGVYTLLEAARLTPEIEYWYIGGYEEDVNKLREEASTVSNVKILGHVPHESVPQYLAAADILVLPNSGTYRMSEKYTSPLKLFEYMASKRPVVASSLPSVREVLMDTHNAYLVDPDNSSALAHGIRAALHDPHKDAIVAQAFLDVQNYSWDERVERILTSIKYDI
jgi:glycosyltransferase involved in cell wall biosynthesis